MGLAARCHCAMKRALCSSNGVASELMVFCAAVWFPSPMPTATVNSITRLPAPSGSYPPDRSSSPSKRDVAVGGRAKLPVHAEVVHQVAPPVARAHKSAAHPRKARRFAARNKPSWPATTRSSTPSALCARQYRPRGPSCRPRPRRDAAPAAHRPSGAAAGSSSASSRTCVSTTEWCGSQMISLVSV